MPAISRHPALQRSPHTNPATHSKNEPNKKPGETTKSVLSLFKSTLLAEGLRALQWRVKPRGALANV